MTGDLMTGDLLTGDLAAVVARMDTDKLRSSPTHLRDTLLDVTAHRSALWTGPLQTLLHALCELGRVDLCLGRLVEGHADALRIMSQAAHEPQPGVYGVWASRSAGSGLQARYDDPHWHLTGQLRFASGIDLIDRALAPGWIGSDHHLLFDIGIDELDADRDSWATTAMDASRSFHVAVDADVTVAPIGPTDFYLDRPGFVVGGLGPAAVWAGGAHQIADLVAQGLRRFDPTPHQLHRVGAIHQAAGTADAALAHVVEALAGHEARADAAELVSQARTAVALSCDVVLEQAPKVVGPGGLSTDRRLARALADLAMYVRQHHLDSELERLGAYALRTRDVLAR